MDRIGNTSMDWDVKWEQDNGICTEKEKLII
jgi:hypothetical protein